MLAQARDAGFYASAAVHFGGYGAILGAWQIAQFLTAPVYADGVDVIGVIRLAR